MVEVCLALAEVCLSVVEVCLVEWQYDISKHTYQAHLPGLIHPVLASTSGQTEQDLQLRPHLQCLQ